nr:hypothetical protein [Ignavibacteria bacterium]
AAIFNNGAGCYKRILKRPFPAQLFGKFRNVKKQSCVLSALEGRINAAFVRAVVLFALAICIKNTRKEDHKEYEYLYQFALKEPYELYDT